MSACEKCWGDAYMLHIQNTNEFPTQNDAYKHLLEERESTPCSYEEQNGAPQ